MSKKDILTGIGKRNIIYFNEILSEMRNRRKHNVRN